MKQVDSNLSAQVDELMRLTKSWADNRCAEIANACDQQIEALLKSAHHEARQRIRNHFESERSAMQDQVIVRDALQDRVVRHQRQHQQTQLVSVMMQALQRELVKRWQLQAERRQWLATIFQLASQCLIENDWTIRHPLSWRQDEIDDFAQQVKASTGIAPVFEATANIEAGLLIESGHAVLNCTVDGLMSNRLRLESELIAAIDQDIDTTGDQQ